MDIPYMDIARMDIAHLEEALDAQLPDILDVCDTPGASIAVGVEDSVAFANGYGYADLAQSTPMTTTTTAPTGSDGKTYTAAAIMQLVERGVIGLDDPVNDHLDSLRIINPHGPRAITLRDLLTHRSGLATGLGNWSRTPPAPLGEHLRRVFAEARSDAYGGTLLPFWAGPVGANYHYSNLGIAVVGHLIELLNPDRASFPDWLRQHVFEPLAMNSTCFPTAQHPDHAPKDLLARRSTGYATLGGYRLALPDFYPGDYPAGSALTTPSDHARFVLAMITPGTILLPPTARMMLTPQASGGTLLGPSPEISVGLVWNILEQGEYFGHGGSYPWGWHNFTRGWPRHRVSLVVNVNQYDLGDFGTSDRPSHLAGRLIANIVGAWVNGADPRPLETTTAARSRLLGLLIGDRITTRFGLRTRPPENELARIAQGTTLDQDAFLAGIAAIRMTDNPWRDAAVALRTAVPAHQLELLARQLGIPGLGKNIPKDIPKDIPASTPKE